MLASSSRDGLEGLIVAGFGRTGVGKSTSLSTFVGKENAFPPGEKGALGSCTRKCHGMQHENFWLMDTIGFKDTKLKQYHGLLLEGVRELTHRGKGVDVFLFFYSIQTKFTETEVQDFKEFLAMTKGYELAHDGPMEQDAINHTIIIFTHVGDETKDQVLDKIKVESSKCHGDPEAPIHFLKNLVVPSRRYFARARVPFAVMGDIEKDHIKQRDRQNLKDAIVELAQRRMDRFPIERLEDSLQWFLDQEAEIQTICNGPYRKRLNDLLEDVKKGAKMPNDFLIQLRQDKEQDCRNREAWWCGIQGATSLGSVLGGYLGGDLAIRGMLSSAPIEAQICGLVVGGAVGLGMGAVSDGARHLTGWPMSVVKRPVKGVIKCFLKTRDGKG